jgi:hypothetical protein
MSAGYSGTPLRKLGVEHLPMQCLGRWLEGT